MLQKTQSSEIDILQLLLVVWRKRWLVIFFTLVFSFIGVAYYFSTSTVYSAKISIQVGIDNENVLSFSDFNLFSGGQSDEDYATQVELIKSRKLLSSVVNSLELDMDRLNDRPISPIENIVSDRYAYYLDQAMPYLHEYLPSLAAYLLKEEETTLDPQIQAIQQLQSMLTVSHQKNSQFIIVTAKSYSPFLSTNIVNTIADTYIAYHQEQRKDTNAGTAAWLLNELETVKADIIKSERELRAFSESEDLVDIQGVMSLKANEIKELSARQTELEQVVDEFKNQYQAMIGVNDPIVLLNSATIKSNPIIEQSQAALSDAEEELLQVSLIYGPKHPNYIFAEKNLQSAKEQLDDQLNALIKVVEVEYLTEQKKLDKLQSLFVAAKEDFQELNGLNGLFVQKKREVEAHQELYETILKKLQEAQTISGLDQDTISVFDYALVEDALNLSKPIVGLVISVVAGVLLGGLVALILGLLDQKVWSVGELRRMTGKAVLGSLPVVKVKRRSTKRKPAPFHEFARDHIYLENIYALRTRFIAKYSTAKVISIASAMPEEGKSTITLNLSQSFAELERVLVIDGDLRRSSISTMLALPENQLGLSDVLSRSAKLSDCIVRNQEHGFDILGAGNLTHHSNSMISSAMMEKLLQHLGKYYDRIVIETAPVNLFSDTEAIAKLVDGILLVVKAEATLLRDVKSAIFRLEGVDANLLGLVLNQSRSTVKRQDYAQYNFSSHDQGYTSFVEPNHARQLAGPTRDNSPSS